MKNNNIVSHIMTDLEFIFSLTPKQIIKFVSYNNMENILVGITSDSNNNFNKLTYYNISSNHRLEAEYINNEWIITNEITLNEK